MIFCPRSFQDMAMVCRDAPATSVKAFGHNPRTQATLIGYRTKGNLQTIYLGRVVVSRLTRLNPLLPQLGVATEVKRTEGRRYVE